MQIKLVGESTLRQKCPLIDINELKSNKKWYESLIFNMTEAMNNNLGIGLAANQVGYGMRLFVTAFNAVPNIYINPSIEWFSKEMVMMEEGCLSVPGTYLRLERPSRIKVKYFDIDDMEYKKVDLFGLPARVAQHEIEHLDGILMTDHAAERTLKLQNQNYGILL